MVVLDHFACSLLEIAGCHDAEKSFRGKTSPRLNAIGGLHDDGVKRIGRSVQEIGQDNFALVALLVCGEDLANGIVTAVIASSGAKNGGNVFEHTVDSQRLRDQTSQMHRVGRRLGLRHE